MRQPSHKLASQSHAHATALRRRGARPTSIHIRPAVLPRRVDIGMAGRDAAVLVLDKRIGAGNNLIGDECCRVLEASKRALLAVRGIQGDVQSLLEDVAARLRLKKVRRGRRRVPRAKNARFSRFRDALRATSAGRRARV